MADQAVGYADETKTERATAPKGMTTADVLVDFGITGDLSKKMTLEALYSLERRGLLPERVVGVAFDDWSLDRLRDHARDSLATAGVAVDPKVFDRFASRLSYVHGDFTDPGTYRQLADALGDAKLPVFYLQIPPSLFGPVVGGLSEAGLTHGARVVVEKPFGHDLASARALNAQLHRYLEENQLYRVDHFLGKLAVEDILYLRFANTMLEPVWNRNHIASVQILLAEDFGVEDRGHFYDPVGALRDVVINHMFEVLAMVALEPPSGHDPDSISDRKADVFKAMRPADPGRYVRGQYDGYLDIDGVAPNSQTETYAALLVELDNWRWSGVPFLLRTGKRLPVTSTEVRVIFRHPPRLGFVPPHAKRPEPNELELRIDPSAGASLHLQGKRSEGAGTRPIHLDMEFAQEGGEGPAAYENLLRAAVQGDRTSYNRQDLVDQTWRVVQPLLDAPPQVRRYEPGSWGPSLADELAARHGGWRNPAAAEKGAS